ncbi:acyltransferase family protein [Halorussus aquaticus]|uniref:Acyltransferase n=1 Tax=Halorussus aquaticus TaxID=2953748 RepID=A0ABD5Q5R1_9EURY|nr:acyltransferase [Halorussus aquaticus]
MERFRSVDYLKGIAILSIFAIHSFDTPRPPVFYEAVIFQAVPLFFLLSGFTSGLYLHKNFNSVKYYQARAYRLFLPLYVSIPFVILSYVVAFQFHPSLSGWNYLERVPLWLTGNLINFGVGASFLPPYLTWAVLFPAIYYVLTSRPSYHTILVFTFIPLAFLSHNLYHLHKELFIALLSPLPGSDHWHVKTLVLNYLPHLALGLATGAVLAVDEWRTRFTDNRLFPILGSLVAGSFYVMGWTEGRGGWSTAHSLSLREVAIVDMSIIYVFAFFLLGIYFFERYQPEIKILQWFGDSSYHLYIVQMAVFRIGYNVDILVNGHSYLGYIVAILVSVPLTVIFKWVTTRVERQLRLVETFVSSAFRWKELE